MANHEAPTSYEEDDGGITVVSDALRVTIYAERTHYDQEDGNNYTGYVCLKLAAVLPISERMADFTPRYDYASTAFAQHEITIDDDGTLTAMHKVLPGAIEICWGVTVRMPPEYVAPVRAALETVCGRINQAFHAQLEQTRQSKA